jgi:hypothetical protein
MEPQDAGKANSGFGEGRRLAGKVKPIDIRCGFSVVALICGFNQISCLFFTALPQFLVSE